MPPTRGRMSRMRKPTKERDRLGRPNVLIGFKAFEDSDADLISWWKHLPHGEGSLLLRKILRDWLDHNDPITAEHMREIMERLDRIDARFAKFQGQAVPVEDTMPADPVQLSEDEIAFRESRIRNQRW